METMGAMGSGSRGELYAGRGHAPMTKWSTLRGRREFTDGEEQ
jgi:hypothetical protein